MKKYFVIALAALIVIFLMANMTYSQQTIIPFLRDILASKPFEQQLRQLEIPYWGRIVSVDNSGYYHFVEFIIRKSAHFFGYGFVGILFYGIYRHLSWRLPAFLAILTIFTIACLDEYRQTLVAGRTGIFSDVLIDTTGACFCIGLFAICLLLFRGTTKVKNAKSFD